MLRTGWESIPASRISTTERGLRALLAELHPGWHYFPNLASGLVSGGGPYSAKPARFCFEQRATEKLPSELGMPNIVSKDSLKQMMPEAHIWPQGDASQKRGVMRWLSRI
jgi:hypothetical protein